MDIDPGVAALSPAEIDLKQFGKVAQSKSMDLVEVLFGRVSI